MIKYDDSYTVLQKRTTHMLSDYLLKLGLSPKEKTIYLALASIGVQPASIIARRLELDRVVTYKHLKKLASMNLVKVFVRDGIQYFGITGAEGIEALLNDRAESIGTMKKEMAAVSVALRNMSRGEGFDPTLQTFQGKSGIKSLFRDLLFEAKKESVLRIRVLTSNTFDQQMGAIDLSVFMKDFFVDAGSSGISLEILEAAGTLIPEYIRRIDPKHFYPEDFPASRGATSVFLVGTALYVASYGDSPIGLKMKHTETSQIFHFFFDVISRNTPVTDLGPKRRLTEWMKRSR